MFGYGFEYEEFISKLGVKRMKERRDVLFDKFAKKMANLARFSTKWLPKYDDDGYGNNRERKTYIEFYAGTNRLYRSPLFKIRCRLNLKTVGE